MEAPSPSPPSGLVAHGAVNVRQHQPGRGAARTDCAGGFTATNVEKSEDFHSALGWRRGHAVTAEAEQDVKVIRKWDFFP